MFGQFSAMHNNVKLEFSGELRKIPPSRMFDETEKDELANFFLVLATVFNDLKGYMIFQELIVDNYRFPDSGETSVHSAEFMGLHIHLTRLIVGTLHEYFMFLNSKKDVISSTEFKSILNTINSKTVEDTWEDIMAVATGSTERDSEFIKNILYIRNKVSFHYDNGKELKRAFCNLFFHREKMEFNNFAYYAVSGDLNKTRFFFADAVTEEYLRMHSDNNDKFETMSGYSKETLELIGKINFVTSRLLKSYLRNLPKDRDEKQLIIIK